MDAMAKHAVIALVRYACKPISSNNMELPLQNRLLRTKELAVIVANHLQIMLEEEGK